MKHPRFAVVSFWSVLLVALLPLAAFGAPSNSPQKEIPAEAEHILSQLPGRQLTVDFVLKKAMFSSDTFKEVRSREPLAMAFRLRSEAVTDSQVSLLFNQMDDRRQPSSPFGLLRNQSTGVTATLQKPFATGTGLSLEVFKGNSQITLPPQFATGGSSFFQAHETRATLSITQELWRNFFGDATRAQQAAFALQSESVELSVKAASEKWALALIQQYYTGWFLQGNLKEMDKQTLRRRRLLEILQVRARRGTSEPSDVHQMEAATQALEISRQETEQKLLEIWRNLVIAVKLPEVLLTIDPRDVPLTLDQPQDLARASCEKADTPPGHKNSLQLTAVERDLTSAESEVRAAESFLRPQVQLGGQLGRNGVDFRDSTDSTSRFVDGAGTMWGVSLQFAMPLSRDREKAQYAEAMSKKMAAEARLNVLRDQDQTSRTNLCADLKRLLDAQTRIGLANQSQRKRVALDEERFRIARIPAFQVIQTEDEAMGTEVSRLQIETALRQTSWAILETRGEVHQHLEKLAGLAPQ